VKSGHRPCTPLTSASGGSPSDPF